MPVNSQVDIHLIEQECFHAIDRVVMGHAFDIHNAMGRFLDERIYQEELARRCRASGFTVFQEVPVRVSHRDFNKPYYLDMLVEHGVIYELKAADGMTGATTQQLINYLMLCGLRHGKLVNFRPASVASRFVSTRIDRQERMNFRLIADEYRDGTDRVRKTLAALLADWGAFLDVHLYREALLHFLRGPESGIRPVPIEVGGQTVGTHKMCLLNSKTAWHISAVRHHLHDYEIHITRLLLHTRLESIHWINFDHQNITIKTLLHDSVEK